MPTYKVRCPKCGAEYEEVHKITESHNPCRDCKHPEMDTVIGKHNFHLIGEGWASKEIREDRQEAQAFR